MQKDTSPMICSGFIISDNSSQITVSGARASGSLPKKLAQILISSLSFKIVISCFAMYTMFQFWIRSNSYESSVDQASSNRTDQLSNVHKKSLHLASNLFSSIQTLGCLLLYETFGC